MPLMLSPVAVSWMVGQSMMRRGSRLWLIGASLGWAKPSFFGSGCMPLMIS